MNHPALAAFAAILLAATPALALTDDHGVVVFTQADALAGNVTPGDAPGFPVTISVGGSYRLGSNLVVTTAVNGIEVRANEVSLDMGGFTLAGSGIGRNGITSFNRTLTVQDGTVRGFTLDGVRTIATTLRVERMRVLSNGRNGVAEDYPNLTGTPIANTTVSFSTITGNVINGIICTTGCRVDNSTINGNGQNGVEVTKQGGVLLGNSIVSNGAFGVFAAIILPGLILELEISAGNNAVIRNGAAPWAGDILPLQPNACSPQPC